MRWSFQHKGFVALCVLLLFASLQSGEGRTYSKVIKMVKSPKTGAYTFQEEMVHNEKVKDFIAK